MIFIDLTNEKPTDIKLPPHICWSQDEWNRWLEVSDLYLKILSWFNDSGCVESRNKFMDDHSSHWTKLKPWLLHLSNGKCWFSEVRDLYSHYDVEHFRPKKEAKAPKRSKKDGYWWLAFDYMNFRVCGNVGNRKKGVWFPIKHGSPCSTYSAPCEESEMCYLLDPINHYDVSLIAFDEEGKVVPMPNSSAWEQERVNETAKYLKLNDHVPLAEARRKVWQQVDLLINDFACTKSRCDSANPVAYERLRAICLRIREMTSAEAELSSVAKFCIAVRNDPQLSKLVA